MRFAYDTSGRCLLIDAQSRNFKGDSDDEDDEDDEYGDEMDMDQEVDGEDGEYDTHSGDDERMSDDDPALGPDMLSHIIRVDRSRIG